MTISKSILISTATLAVVAALGGFVSTQTASANTFTPLTDAGLIAANSVETSPAAGYDADAFIKYNDGSYPQAGIVDKAYTYNADGANAWNAGWSLAHTSLVIGYITKDTDEAALKQMIQDKVGLQLHSSTEVVEWDWSQLANLKGANGGNCINIMLKVTSNGVQQPAQIYLATDPHIATPTINDKKLPAVESDFVFTVADGKATLADYKGSDNTVVIPEFYEDEFGEKFPVTVIGYAAFASNKQLEHVVLPVTLEKIEGFAFVSSGLKEIRIPGNVKEIDAGAFQSASLVTVNIDEGVQSIGFDAFYDNQITTLTLPSSINSDNLGDGVFQKNKITNVEIPKNWTRVPQNTFSMNDLTSVVIPEGVKDIGTTAFYDNELTEVTFPLSMENVGYSAFAYNQLQEVAFPNVNTTYVYNVAGRNSFDDGVVVNYPTAETSQNDFDWSFSEDHAVVTGYHGDATEVVIPAYVYAEEGGEALPVTEIAYRGLVNNNFTKVGLPDTLVKIGESAFRGNVVSDINFPNSLTSIGKDAFYSNKLTSALLPDSITQLGSGVFSWNNITEAHLPSNITKVDSFLFTGNDLTSVEIPEGVTSIGDSAFLENNHLTSVKLPYSLLFIDIDAFTSTQLKQVFIPNPDCTYEYSSGRGYAFTPAGEWKTEILQPAKIQADLDFTVADGQATITGYHGDSLNISLPDRYIDPIDGTPAVITAIGDNAFDLKGLESISLNDSLKTIGVEAFRWNKITNIDLKNVENIGAHAFDHSRLTTLTLSNKVKTVDTQAFGYNQIATLNLPNTAVVYGESAFSGNELTAVTLPASLTELTDGMFSYNDIATINLDNIQTIGRFALADNQLTSVTIPEGVTAISDYAFINNHINELNLPASLTSIGKQAFRNNDLETVLFNIDAVTYVKDGSIDDSFDMDTTILRALVPRG